jgi:UDP-N-acetyl-D-glucosamine dehydrogenase
MNIGIVGLGYVGLPLCLQFARNGAKVLGLDVDAVKVDAINGGRSYIEHIDGALIAQAVADGTLSASTDFSRVKDLDAVIICVPTPLNRNREPDISYIIKTGQNIAPHLSRGTLVSLESTTYPGTTDEDLREVLEAGSGMKAGVDFHLAFSPEREDPGNPDSKVAQIRRWLAASRRRVSRRPSRSTPLPSRPSCPSRLAAWPRPRSSSRTSSAA